jgi:hypothetical protein
VFSSFSFLEPALKKPYNPRVKISKTSGKEKEDLVAFEWRERGVWEGTTRNSVEPIHIAAPRTRHHNQIYLAQVFSVRCVLRTRTRTKSLHKHCGDNSLEEAWQEPR